MESTLVLASIVFVAMLCLISPSVIIPRRVWSSSQINTAPSLNFSISAIALSMESSLLMKGDLDKGIKCTERSLKLRNELGNTQEVARSLTQMGFIFFLKGEYDSVLKYLEESLKLEEGSFNRNILVTITCIGHVNLSRGNLDHALEYYQKSFKLAKEMNTKDIIAWNLLSFGIEKISSITFNTSFSAFQYPLSYISLNLSASNSFIVFISQAPQNLKKERGD